MSVAKTRKRNLGKVFVSHSSKDKPFVRRLAEAIWKDGYQVWLDEKELVPGDALAERLSEAIKDSKVICVVVSKHSLESAWVKFEVNKATGLMVSGDCRIMPVLLGGIEVPPELEGLLYADFRKSFAYGYRAVKAALEKEAQDAHLSDWERLRSLVESTLGGFGSVSLMGEYESLDYETISLPGVEHRDESGYDADVVVDCIHAGTGYRGSKPLNDSWWQEYREVHYRYMEPYHLVVSERAIDISELQPSGANSRVLSHFHEFANEIYVVADVASLNSGELKKDVLLSARDEIARLAAVPDFASQQRR